MTRPFSSNTTPDAEHTAVLDPVLETTEHTEKLPPVQQASTGSRVMRWGSLSLAAVLIGSGLTLTADYLIDGENDIVNSIEQQLHDSSMLQSLGLVDTPAGPTAQITDPGAATGTAAPTQAAAPVTADRTALTLDANGVPRNQNGLVPGNALNFTADDLGMPIGTDDGAPTTGIDSLEDIDLSGISPGGGYGPEGYNWKTIGPSTLQVPQTNLTIPWVPKGTRVVNAGEVAMNLPVSFQAGWLSSSAPVDSTEGSTVIAAHVNWADGSYAPMSNLYGASPGMMAYTSNAAGEIQTWRITEVHSVAQSELSSVFNLSSTGDRQLVMLTCEATINADGSVTYNKNHVVTAVPA